MLRLVPIYNNHKELQKIAEWRNKTMNVLRSSIFTDPETQHVFIDTVKKNGDQYYFIYEDDILVGYCGLDKISPTNRTAEISLLIAPDKRAKGYGKESVKLLLEDGFNRLNLHCIHGEVYTNHDGWQFWESCGFVMDGRFRARKYWEGEYHDSVIFSMLKNEYKELNKI